ncbi:MAG: tetratricopeptide repeat protein, partial [Candidatus Marinimicrobia bacterium]|nr:tetratricopeptide repeat protein [Candidatus Neomarinimicrobiota bacterium]
MTKKFKYLNIIGLISLIVGISTYVTFSQVIDSTNIDWSQPKTIDPFTSDVTSFLNVQWQEYDQIGLNHLQQGNYMNAARYFIAALRFNADDVISLYNLACCYSRLGEPELAVYYIKKAHEAGYSDYSYFMADTDFVDIRYHTDFINCMEKIKNTSQNTGKVLYVEASKLIPCRVHVPPDFDPDQEYPLLIGLHGYTGNAESMSRLWRLFKKQNFIYVCPEAPYTVVSSTGN